MKGFSRVLQKEVQQGLSMAYQIGVDEAKAIQVCSKQIQSCSSGKKLEPAVWKFVQRLKTLSASSALADLLISKVVDLLLRRRWLLREA